MMYGSWDMEYNRQNFLSFWTVFCPFIPLTTRKIKILKKWKKLPGDIIILYMYTTNENHMMYGSCVMECDGQKFLSFWTVFCPFTPLTTNPKNQNFQKMKKTLGYIIFLHMCTINGNHLMYGSWNIERNKQNFWSVWTILYIFTPLITQKFKILKNFKKWKKKKHLEILSFYTSVLYPRNNWKNQNFEKLKKKKYLEISSFYKKVQKIMITCYTVP